MRIFGIGLFLGIATGLVLALLGAAFAMFGLTLLDARPGDWMGFAGTLIGAMITVAGALFVVQWQREGEADDKVATIAKLLDDSVLAGETLVSEIGRAKDADADQVEQLASIQAESLIAARAIADANKALNANVARTWRALDLPDEDLTHARDILCNGKAAEDGEGVEAAEMLAELARSARYRLKC